MAEVDSSRLCASRVGSPLSAGTANTCTPTKLGAQEAKKHNEWERMESLHNHVHRVGGFRALLRMEKNRRKDDEEQRDAMSPLAMSSAVRQECHGRHTLSRR